VLCGHALQASAGRHTRANRADLVNRVRDVVFDSLDPIESDKRVWLVMFAAPTIDRNDAMAHRHSIFHSAQRQLICLKRTRAFVIN